MFIYNVTVNVSNDVHAAWLSWMREEHVIEVMKTNCFVDSSILKVLFVEDEGHTYSIQYKFLELADFEKYKTNFAPALQAKHKAKFDGNFVAFRTILEVIE